MNRASIVMTGLALACVVVAKELPLEAGFRAYRATDAKALGVVRQLQGFKARDLKIEDLELSEAIDRLQRACVQGDAGAVINFVIRYPKVHGGGKDSLDAGGTPVGRPKVTLRAELVDFASAVDRLCRQIGYRWSLEIPRETGIPVLVITAKSG